MFLCKMCNSANGKGFTEGDCYICENKSLKLDEIEASASALIIAQNAASFSISTIIPKDWLSREENVWDKHVSDSESVKSSLNRKLIASIRNATNLKYSSDGEYRIVADFSNASVTVQRNELFIFGRYRKLVAGLSQSRWRCSKCEGKGCPQCDGKGKYYDSVEERIGEPIKKMSDAEDYVLHASGREDVDATNSAGRAFVLELKNPKERNIDFNSASVEIAKSGDVEVSDLRTVARGFCEIVTESHFDKTYEAEVEFGREINAKDLESIRGLEGKNIIQQTPNRVVHRRADIIRHRKIKSIKTINGTGNRATIIIKAEAGTYIKELISGDNGRTKPSISELLETTSKCKKLEVTKIEDEYLDFCLNKLNK